MVGESRIADAPVATDTHAVVALLVAIGLADTVPGMVAGCAVALVVVLAEAPNSAVRFADGLASVVGQLVSLGAAADLRFGAVVPRTVATPTAADGAAEAARLVQLVARIALAAAVQETLSILAAQRTGEHTVAVVVLHESLVALALPRNPAAPILAATLRPAHGDALQPTGRVSGAADLDEGQPVRLVRLDDAGVRVLFNRIGWHPNAALVLPSIGRRFMGSNQVFPTFRWLLNDSGILEIGCSRSIKGQLPAFHIAAAIATWILGYGSPVISFRIVGHICVNSG